MPGFANRVKTLIFPELTEDGERTLFVALRNPKTMPMEALVPQDIPRGPDGAVLDPAAAETRSREIVAKLVIGWRMYDATDFSIDDEGNPVDQALLPLPATPESVAKLPMVVIQQINTAIVEAINPQ
jgi:hypothetical protein